MLQNQLTLNLDPYGDLMDRIIPQDSKLRRLKEMISFGFIYKVLGPTYCPDNGRTALDPVLMFKYLLLKKFYDLSDVDVVSRSRVDLEFKYFLGLPLEQTDMINPSSLTVFRREHVSRIVNDKGEAIGCAGLINLLIEESLKIARENGVGDSSDAIIVDSVHTLARCNSVKPLDMLRQRSKDLRKAIYQCNEVYADKMPQKNTDSDLEHEFAYVSKLISMIDGDRLLQANKSVMERLSMLKEAISDIQDRYETAPKEPDARTGHKDADTDFFGFKTHMAMNTDRLITAADVTSGEKADGPRLQELVEKSRDNGATVDTVIGDMAYSGTDNIRSSEDPDSGFELIARLHPVIGVGYRKKDDEFDFNKDAGMFVCPAGHMAISKTISRKRTGENDRMVYEFDINKCRCCSRKDQCLKKPDQKGKTYSVSLLAGEHSRQLAKQDTEGFRIKSKERYKIEAKNGEMKNSHGYRRADSYGLENMRLQCAVTVFAVNLKRIITLISEKNSAK